MGHTLRSRSYQICSKTVMDTTDPEITFSPQMISNHAREFDEFILPRWDDGRCNEQKLFSIADKIKSLGKHDKFDCILGLSGGLDSSYLLHIAVRKLGLRPLVFHVDGGWNSEIAVKNIRSMVSALNVQLFTEVIRWNEMREFQLAMFRSGVPHLDIPQDMAFVSVLYKFAAKHGIKSILNGGNVSTESVLMPLQFLYWGTDMTHVKDILRCHSQFKFKKYPFSSVYYHKIFLPYFKKIRVYKLLNFTKYRKKDAIDLLSENYGWEPYKQKHFESRFTRFFEGYWLPKRFNYDMRRNQFSSLILSNQMSRDDALFQLQTDPLSRKEIVEEKSFLADKLEISIDELEGFFQMEKRFYWDYRNDKRLIDFGEKILKYFKGVRRGGAF